MKAEWDSYSPDTKQIATAFTNGINACIKHLGKRLPIEFDILGYEPRPCGSRRIILGRMSGIVMSRNFSDEVVRAMLIDRLGLDKVRELMPTDPEREFAPAPGLDLKGIDRRILEELSGGDPGRCPSRRRARESNNWVVSGGSSVVGKAAAGQRSAPGHRRCRRCVIWCILNAPGWNVIGAGEPALPGVAIGHNDRIAWGITIVGTDQADIFVEETKPDDPTLYKVGERLASHGDHQGNRFLVKDGKARTVELRYTRHGPVIYQDEKTTAAYALKWAGSEPGGAGYLASLAVARAGNQKEFLQALESVEDSEPELRLCRRGQQHRLGRRRPATPIRPKHDGLLPVPGNAGYEWTGYLGIKDLPQICNPNPAGSPPPITTSCPKITST